MPKSLVIVESPAKAKTIGRFLGSDFVVKASVGHVRDLPRGAADVPAAYKGEPWARLGVDVDNDFKTLYVVSKKDVIRDLKAELKNVDEVFLATDEDREGESISWHLLELLSPRVPVKRMVFHEITKEAIEHAVNNWRDIDYALVDAQETRRILDRLYGYEVSPVLWRIIGSGLSAGRVQSVATRIIVEREQARMRFVAAGFWDLEAAVASGVAGAPATSFKATLVELDAKRLATGKDFDENGHVSNASVVVLSEPDALALSAALDGRDFSVKSVEERPFRQQPKAPFMTTTLQVEGGNKLRMTSAQVMRVAQGLYERGYITYMRTDSTTLSQTALDAARRQVRELYGNDYLPAKPRMYDKKVKNAQEAHEAIRPAGESFRTPDQVARELSADELRVYELIWKRTVASQMADATGVSVQVRIQAETSSGRQALFGASGRTISFPGYLRAYVEGADDPEAELEDKEAILPPLASGDPIVVHDLAAKGHSTQPPARFTEASLVKRLEELGVGRPSTYATVMQTIQDRGYAWKKGTALVPTWTAFAVIRLLVQHFPTLVDYAFTARLEDDLDEIANRHQERVPWLSRFYFGGTEAGAEPGLKSLVQTDTASIDAAEINSIPIGLDPDGVLIVVKPGKFGPYVKRGDDTASVPESLCPDEMTVDKALELLAAPKGEQAIGVDPVSGLDVFAKNGRFGPYVQLGKADDSEVKPRMASLFKTMTLETLTLEQALQVLQLPRLVGVDPDGAEIVAQNGRYGPYIQRGSDSRSLESEHQLLTISVAEALVVLAQPKRGRGQSSAASAAPLRELGPDPASGGPVVVKEGRFGPYVTDGVTNASLRKGDTIAEITIERAAELLQMRREAEPRPKRAVKKAVAKKAVAKKPAAKKAVAKKAVKKAAKKTS